MNTYLHIYEKGRDKQNAIRQNISIFKNNNDEREKESLVSRPFLLTWDSLGPISKVLLARLFRSRARARLVHED